MTLERRMTGRGRALFAVFVLALAMSCLGRPMVAMAEQTNDGVREVAEGSLGVGDGWDSVVSLGLGEPGSEDAQRGMVVELGDDVEVVDGSIEAPDVQPNGSGDVPLEAQAAEPHVSYRTHVQTYGWQGFSRDGEVSGTSGQSKRLEGIELRLEGVPYTGSIQYRTHVQTYGWQGWVADGAMSGTSGQAKRLEAIEIRLTGAMASNYDVWYRVHAQTYGWMGWAKNGERAGTATMAKRLEAIQVVLQPKGSAAPSNTYRGIARSYAAAYATRQLQYRTHVQTYGWQEWAFDGQMSGTSGQAKRLEGIELRLADPLFSGSIQYRTHVQTYGWQGWVADGAMSGTTGQAKRLEAIQIRLTGEMASRYDVWYHVHAQTFGWMGWAKNGDSAGTEGYSKRLEAIEVVLTPKGAAAPGATADAFRKRQSVSVSYEDVYGPIVRSAANEARSKNRDYPKYVYFLFDINADGIKELVVDNKGMGTAYSNADVYTISTDGGASARHVGQSVGLAGFRSYPRNYNGRLRAVHRMANAIEQYEIELRDGRVVDNLIGVYQINQKVTNEGSPITYYTIYSNYNGEYKTSIDYTGLRNAGNVTLLV